MTTKLNNIINFNTRGLLYICEFNRNNKTLTVLGEIQFLNALDALDAYANVPNPESQLVTGKTYEEFCTNLERLHTDMVNDKWLVELSECI